MNNRIFCSTGTYIGPENNFDYRLIPKLSEKINVTEFELMIVNLWDGMLDEISRYLKDSMMIFRVVHSDKDIGTFIGEGRSEEAIKRYSASIKAAYTVGAEKMVLHLWGGKGSDYHFEENLKVCKQFVEQAEYYGITLCVENVPCRVSDPLTHFADLMKLYPSLSFILDTRFTAFAAQYDDVESDTFNCMWNKKIVHMHISDFIGPPHDFTKLRPIPHPGKGIIDFDRFFKSVLPKYHGTITLESPSIRRDGSIDVTELNKSLDFIKEYVDNVN